MRDELALEISKTKADLEQKLAQGALGEQVASAITKLTNDRIIPLETMVLKLKAKESEARSLRDAVIEKTSYGKPFIFKADNSQSFNDWAHKVSVYLFGIGSSESAHLLLKWCVKQTVPIELRNAPPDWRDEEQKVSHNLYVLAS